MPCFLHLRYIVLYDGKKDRVVILFATIRKTLLRHISIITMILSEQKSIVNQKTAWWRPEFLSQYWFCFSHSLAFPCQAKVLLDMQRATVRFRTGRTSRMKEQKHQFFSQYESFVQLPLPGPWIGNEHFGVVVWSTVQHDLRSHHCWSSSKHSKYVISYQRVVLGTNSRTEDWNKWNSAFLLCSKQAASLFFPLFKCS